ncbi:SIR2 family protein [Wenzhouxiangella sp. AB-CW3]|uniref:SIR2 family NAD-dependent protein deacylase n=1 Tax=Wenzhouxiangella sp. AB-CW3 TaxID=2771012 RepID=UPI00168AB05E|nr:SIR2 family protein [Wenzhouxiangella sp. AB-CW3]QOC22241.1 SIR2 family protein [Wenzhouxiangella sp. AB-CW3]
MPKDANALREAVNEFFGRHGDVYLFAGAGVGVAAGLPDWKGFLENLAQTCRQYDINLYHAMAARISQNRLTSAATLYFIADIPEAERYSAIRDQLREYNHKGVVKCLTKLPVSGVVTTNYDRSLLDVYSSDENGSPSDFFYPDPSLNQVQFSDDFFVARIHGRIENPNKIVLQEQDYDALIDDTTYLDVLTYLFAHCNLLVVGYSFLDPAIQNVLTAVAANVGTIQSGRHLALIPDDESTELVGQLSKLNVEVLTYDSKDNHRVLWDAICRTEKSSDSITGLETTDPFVVARAYFATCYARYKMQGQLAPLLDIIVEGVLLSELDKVDGSIDVSKLVENVADVISVRSVQIENDIRGQLFKLNSGGYVAIVEGNVSRVTRKAPRKLEDLDTLAKSIGARMDLEGVGLQNEAHRKAIAPAIEHLVLSRGWHLSASFATHRVPDHVSVPDIFHGYSFPKGFPKKTFTRSVEGMLFNPEPRESKALARLGEIAFGLELVLRAPRSAFFLEKTLPEEIYLDANVLMPAIVHGHPFNAVYSRLIRKIQRFAAESKSNLFIRAHRVVLNEIVSHRRLAIQEYERLGSNDSEVEREATYYGLDNMNVFLAGYIQTKRDGAVSDFSEYIRKYASYGKERDLEGYLKRTTTIMLVGNERTEEAESYPDILHALEKAYSRRSFWERKDAALIRHDAQQLSRLHSGVMGGKRSIFVTADRTLRQTLGETNYADLSNYMMSHVGLVNMTRLIAAAYEDGGELSTSTGRLMWAVSRTDHAERIRRYLINQALREYDAALAASMGSVVDDIAEDVVIEANRRDIDLDANSALEKDQIGRLFDEYEDRFFEKMRDVVRQRESGRQS